VTVSGSPRKSVKNACTGKFVDFAFR